MLTDDPSGLMRAKGSAMALCLLMLASPLAGCFGEIDPAISQTFELLVPLNGAEFDVEALKLSITDPV